MSWIWLLVTLLLGGLGGYILKDQLTVEYKSEVSIVKPKVKGKQNKLDLDQITEVHMKPMTWKEKRAAKKEAREQKKNNS